MKIIPVCPYSFGSNTYLLLSGSEAIVVDPSVSVRAIDSLLEQNRAKLCGILLTHGHFDHTVAVDTLRDAHPVPLMMHSGDAPMMTDRSTAFTNSSARNAPTAPPSVCLRTERQ